MLTKVEITHKTILFTLGILGLIWFILQIQEIILVLFLAFILMSALRPLVEGLEKFRIPRLLAILLLYFMIILSLGVFGSAVIPGLIWQTVRFWEKLPEIINKILPLIPLNLEFVSQQLTPVSSNILRVTLGFFSNIFTVLTIMVLTFYLLMERKNLEEAMKAFLGEANGEKAVQITWKIEDKLGAWVRGQLLLMFIIGFTSYIGLSALGVEYALPLAITVGIFEIVPIVGSIIASIPAILVAFVTSPVLAVAVMALYFIIHQTEGNLIVPTVMKKAVGLSPIITLLALMIGAKLAGIFGAILAVPTVVVLQVILQEVSEQKK